MPGRLQARVISHLAAIHWYAMTDAPVPLQWIDLFHCDDPRDVVHQAVACLAQGGLIGLATETVYTLAASALHQRGLGRLRSLGLIPSSEPLALLVKGPEECADWVPGISQIGRRLAQRLWPGPLTLVFPRELSDGLFGCLPPEAQKLIAPAGGLALRCSADPFLRDILQLTSAPLALGPASAPEGPAAITAGSLRGLAGLDLVIDSGPTHCGETCTHVRIDKDRWTIEREGLIDSKTLTQMSGRIILFICTGNTCRSPMAEAICKLLLAKRFSCLPEELEDRGYVVLSAGVAAATGAPAAAHAADILRAMGGSLDAHRSRRVTLDLIHQADWIFAMTADHYAALLDAVPASQGHTFLLDPEGGDVPDPVGSDHQTYLHTAQMIERMLEERLRQIGL
jgi:protein-tyrosine phosphatase